MRKEVITITFDDGTKGTITNEIVKGRIDVKAEYAGVKEFYYTEHVDNSWLVKKCIDGFCYIAVVIANKQTRKEAFAEICLCVRKNQARTAYTYILETPTGEQFTVVATSETLAKECVRFKRGIELERLLVKEYWMSGEDKQSKAKIGEYADFINEILPTPSDEPKTEEEEEAANEHFVKQMSESDPEYMGIEYTDALQMNNWKNYLLDTLYEGEEKHVEIYIVVSGECEVKGWYWNKKGAEQFQRLHGGEIIKVTSALFYIQKICDLYHEIIRRFDIDGMSITSQLMYNGYRVTDKNTPTYILECLHDYCWLYETDVLFRKHFGINYSVTLSTYLKLTQNALDNKKDTEKTLQGFCKNMLYLTDYAIFEFLTSVLDKRRDMKAKQKLNSFYGMTVCFGNEEDENNDNC